MYYMKVVVGVCCKWQSIISSSHWGLDLVYLNLEYMATHLLWIEYDEVIVGDYML